MQSAWLLGENPDPTEGEIREGISGNLCRCTGYVNIVKAVQQAAGTLREAASAPVVAADTVDGRQSRPNRPRPVERGETTMTTETDRHLRTSPEIGGMGHSVKRKEDPRFIQGQGEYIDDVNLPGPALAGHRPQPVRPRDHQVDRRDARRSRSRASPRSSPARTWRGYKLALDADAGRRHADGAARGHRHVPVPGGRGRHRHLPLRRRRRGRRRPRRLRAAAGHRRPAQGHGGGRLRPPSRPRPGQADQPHLALGIGRRGRRRRGHRRRPR